ncbi:MAG: tyrosine-type recombinase/integrase [Candidatus Woesearchaeota archaeon]
MEQKFDPHNSKGKYTRWRTQEGAPLEGVTPKNKELLIQYLDDMELGTNVAVGSKRGSRSYIRLKNLKSYIHSWALVIQEEVGIGYIPDLVHKEKEFLQMIKKLRDGQVKSRNPTKPYITGAGNFVKAFKAFWHWYQKIQRKEGNTIPDITQDLDVRDPKPKFNYFTIDQLNQLCAESSYDYRTLMMFLFDSGIRAPTELMNVKVSDLVWDDDKKHYTLIIRDETSKTFGRKIKLLLCSKILRRYIKDKKIKNDEFIFTKTPQVVNKYLKKLAHKLLQIGEMVEDRKKLKGGNYYYYIKDGLTLYDFRHSSACYWLIRYKSESALKYRFGWVRSSMIHYYTELLGMRDTIEEDDLYVDISKTQLENEINKKGAEINLLQEQLAKEEEKAKFRDEKLLEQEEKIEQMMEVLKSIQLEQKMKQNKPYSNYIEM